MHPATSSAHGIALRGFCISSPIAETASIELNAKNTLDQNTALLSDQCGTIPALVKCVAEPNREYDIAAISINTDSGTTLPSAPILFSHLPTSAPTIFSSVIRVSAIAANAM